MCRIERLARPQNEIEGQLIHYLPWATPQQAEYLIKTRRRPR
jgi:hypothetical protein